MTDRRAKLRLTANQLYWLGRLTGYHVDTHGQCVGSRGYADWTINPGRADGAEYTLETLCRKGLCVWLNAVDRRDIPAGNGFAITVAGVEQWLAHFPDRPILTNGRGRTIVPQPTPAPGYESPTYRPSQRLKRIIVPTFTTAELEHLADLFDGANDPLSAAIGVKARQILTAGA